MLAQLVKIAGYEVMVIDPRTAFAAEARFPGIRLDTEWPQDAIPKIGLDPYTAVVALAHVGHIDDEALKLAMRSDCFYVGALGSRRNHAKRTQRLTDAGFSDEEIKRIHSPIGINIGAQSPQEIAISIMAELVLALRGPKVYKPADAPRTDGLRPRRQTLRSSIMPLGERRRCSKPTSTTDCARRSAATPARSSRVRPDDLLAGVVKEVVARSGFAPEIDRRRRRSAAPRQAGEDSRNVARHALLLAGLPIETPGAVHNRLCGSGLNALVGAAHAITCGEADVCVAGGVESMTRAPFVVGKAEQAVRQGLQGVRFLARRALPQPEDREPVRRRHHAADGRQPGARLPAHARGVRQVRARLAAEVCQGRQGRASSRARSSRSRSPQAKGKPDVGGQRGRASAPRHDHGQPAEAASRCSPTA